MQSKKDRGLHLMTYFGKIPSLQIYKIQLLN